MLSSFNDDDPSSEIDKQIIERYVLALIYFATNGDNWDNDLDFLSNATVCDWPSNTSKFRSMGVHCDSVTGRVKSVMFGTCAKGLHLRPYLQILILLLVCLLQLLLFILQYIEKTVTT